MQLVREITQNQQEQQIPPGSQVHQSSTLIKVNADTTQNKKIISIWCSFFMIVAMLYALTLAVPDTFIRKIEISLDCPSQIKNSSDAHLKQICSQFRATDNPYYGGLIYSMSRLNQFLSVSLIFSKRATDLNNDIEYVTSFEGWFYELEDDLSLASSIETKQTHNVTITCPKNSLKCDEILILYYSQIHYSNYGFVLHFLNTASATNPWPLSNIVSFTQDYVNSDYTGFLIALRYTCLVVSIVMFLAYLRKLQRIATTHWVIEQKLIMLLSGLLILFNNPFYAITILLQNAASAVFEVIFILNFFVMLLFFFLVILDRIANENGAKQSKAINKRKIIFSLVLYFFLFFTYLGFSLSHLDDPFTSFKDSFGGFYQACKIIGILLLIGYFIAMLMYYIKICRVFNSRIWRNKLLSLFSMYYIMCCALFVFSGSLDIYGSVGGRALLFITILNLYVYYLQYMYSFSPEGFQEAAQLINLEIGNQPQIYEILDDSMHGIEIDGHYGQADEDGINKPLNINKNQQIEQELAADIFREHQEMNGKEKNSNFSEDPRNSFKTTDTKKSTPGMRSSNLYQETPEGQEQEEQQQQQNGIHDSSEHNNENQENQANNSQNRNDLDIKFIDDSQDKQSNGPNKNNNEDAFVLKFDEDED